MFERAEMLRLFKEGTHEYVMVRHILSNGHIMNHEFYHLEWDGKPKTNLKYTSTISSARKRLKKIGFDIVAKSLMMGGNVYKYTIERLGKHDEPNGY